MLRACVEKGGTMGVLDQEERERERETKLAYINIYVCTEVVTTRLRAGFARAGYLTLHALTHTHTQTTQTRWSLCWEHGASR